MRFLCRNQGSFHVSWCNHAVCLGPEITQQRCKEATWWSAPSSLGSVVGPGLSFQHLSPPSGLSRTRSFQQVEMGEADVLHGWQASFSQAGTSRQVLVACSDKLSLFVVTRDCSRMEKGLCLCSGYKASQIISVTGFSLAPHRKGELHLTDGRTGLPRVWWTLSPTQVLLPLLYH